MFYFLRSYSLKISPSINKQNEVDCGVFDCTFKWWLKKYHMFWKGRVKERPRKNMKPTVLDPVQKGVLLSALPCPIIPASAPAQHPRHQLAHLLNL